MLTNSLKIAGYCAMIVAIPVIAAFYLTWVLQWL